MKYSDAEIRGYLEGELEKYAVIPSLSGKEHRMLAQVEQDFHCKDGDNLVVYKNDFPFYFARIPKKLNKRFVFSVHLDRVPDGSEPYVNIIDSNEVRVKGQLDDIIAIAILRYLVEIEKRQIPIVFTCKEEWGESWEQVQDVCKLYNRKPISIDIDIFDTKKAEHLSAITLRYRDRNADFDQDLVEELHQIAKLAEVPFLVEQGTAIVEPGFLALHTHGRMTGAHIGLPLLHYHTNREEVTWTAILNCVKFLCQFLLY